MEKHPGIQHSVFLASYLVRRDKYRELSADWQSPQEYVGSAGQMTSICPSLLRYTLASWSCCPCFSLFIVRGVPFQYAVLVFTL